MCSLLLHNKVAGPSATELDVMSMPPSLLQRMRLPQPPRPRIAEDDVAELEDRKTVFLELDIARAAGRYGDTAHRDIGVAFTARRFGADTGNLANEVRR